jgi:hypothetical protein
VQTGSRICDLIVHLRTLVESEAGFPAILSDAKQGRVICNEHDLRIAAGVGTTQSKKLWNSVENEEFLSKAVDFRDLSMGVFR